MPDIDIDPMTDRNGNRIDIGSRVYTHAEENVGGHGWVRCIIDHEAFVDDGPEDAIDPTTKQWKWSGWFKGEELEAVA